MSVVINDFEIVTEPSPTASPEAPQPDSAASPAPPRPRGIRPRDVEAIIERAVERRRRVRAH